MGKITASCGHEVSELKDTFVVLIKAYSPVWEKTIFYLSVCHSCRKYYTDNNYIFNCIEDAEAWLTTKEW